MGLGLGVRVRVRVRVRAKVTLTAVVVGVGLLQPAVPLAQPRRPLATVDAAVTVDALALAVAQPVAELTLVRLAAPAEHPPWLGSGLGVGVGVGLGLG